MPWYPESKSVRRDITCDNCNGACCRKGTGMAMSTKEVAVNFLTIRRQIIATAMPVDTVVVTAADRQHPTPYEITIPANTEISILTSDCGHLTVDQQCAVYGLASRPRACVEFEAGSEACLYSREQAGFID